MIKFLVPKIRQAQKNSTTVKTYGVNGTFSKCEFKE
jgi:hypothetical protein